jgi:hypothetical protein
MCTSTDFLSKALWETELSFAFSLKNDIFFYFSFRIVFGNKIAEQPDAMCTQYRKSKLGKPNKIVPL